MPAYRLDLSYDGTGFHGFARQAGLRTVQGEVERVLGRVLGEPVATVGAGRTDRGVHARRQVVSFATGREVRTERIVSAVNGLLGPEIAALDAAPVPDAFSARHSARWRAYRYFLLTRQAPDPLRHRYTWHVPEHLDVAAMVAAAAPLVGEHDFSSFCRAAGGRSLVRRVTEAGWATDGDLAVFSVRATAFCHQMVRSLVGFLVDVGRGRRPADATSDVLAARDRSRAAAVAPPHGLVLWDVGY